MIIRKLIKIYLKRKCFEEMRVIKIIIIIIIKYKSKIKIANNESN